MIGQTRNIKELIIKRGKLTIDMRCYRVRLNNKEIELLPKEFMVLCLLAQHPDWVFTKNEIYEKVYEEARGYDIDNIISCQIYSLRKKLEPDPKHPQYIKTIRGVGYKFMCD